MCILQKKTKKQLLVMGKNTSLKSRLMMFSYLRKLVHVDIASSFIEEYLSINGNFETKKVRLRSSLS